MKQGKLIRCWAWRHPEPRAHAGRCIGRTNLALDRRRAKRLAHRIRQHARRQGLAHVVYTSPLLRCALVGRILRSWGWRHIVQPALLEMDFGRWDGQPWSRISRSEVDIWCDNFLDAKPGGGESLDDVFERVQVWLSDMQVAQSADDCIVVAHAGWMLCARWLLSGQARPQQAAQWPAPPAYGELWRLEGCFNSDQRPRPASDRPWPPTSPGRDVPV